MMIETKEGLISREGKAAENISELSRFFEIFNNSRDSKRHVLRNISAAIVENFNNWCGGFSPDRAEIVIMMGNALTDVIGDIRKAEAYYVGDYLMSVIMQCDTVEQAERAVYDAANSETLHNDVCEHIAVLIGK